RRGAVARRRHDRAHAGSPDAVGAGRRARFADAHRGRAAGLGLAGHAGAALVHDPVAVGVVALHRAAVHGRRLNATGAPGPRGGAALGPLGAVAERAGRAARAWRAGAGAGAPFVRRAVAVAVVARRADVGRRRADRARAGPEARGGLVAGDDAGLRPGLADPDRGGTAGLRVAVDAGAAVVRGPVAVGVVSFGRAAVRGRGLDAAGPPLAARAGLGPRGAVAEQAGGGAGARRVDVEAGAAFVGRAVAGGVVPLGGAAVGRHRLHAAGAPLAPGAGLGAGGAVAEETVRGARAGGAAGAAGHRAVGLGAAVARGRAAAP